MNFLISSLDSTFRVTKAKRLQFFGMQRGHPECANSCIKDLRRYHRVVSSSYRIHCFDWQSVQMQDGIIWNFSKKFVNVWAWQVVKTKATVNLSNVIRLGAHYLCPPLSCPHPQGCHLMANGCKFLIQRDLNGFSWTGLAAVGMPSETS